MSEIRYTMKPIEAYYRGYKFRSRLEARWAAFFDLCQWRWEYEPVDFNGWFPDFVLLGKRGPVYVEVKPVGEPNQELFDRLWGSLPGECSTEILVCGLSPMLRRDWEGQEYPAYMLGWLCEEGSWDEAPLGLTLPPDGGGDMPTIVPALDFCHGHMSFVQRMSGIYPGGQCPFQGTVKVAELWGLAHEMTRYDPS